MLILAARGSHGATEPLRRQPGPKRLAGEIQTLAG
jgi:hypothetical protein